MDLVQIYALNPHFTLTFMSTKEKELTPVQRAVAALPSRSGVYKRAGELLAERGKAVTQRHIYQVAQGRSNSTRIVTAILDAVEETRAKADALNARAEQLANA